MTDNNINSEDNISDNISNISLVEEMKKSYLDYAMSVIVSRALPDCRDGLKPVHRRILYAMNESGYNYNKPYRKSARIVGDVMGKYHPHGDSAIYQSMVRMAQDFSMRLELIDGQGNFGSLDGDPPAAMRYTEARLAKVAEKIVADLEKETISFQANYDDSSKEPTVLPAQYPNLLVNGASGIAVGMATNIAPHNLGEVIDATLHLIENPKSELVDLTKFIFGPDFPTGGQIIGKKGILDAFQTGKGGVVLRSKTSIENFKKDREAIIVNEIPYQVNKSKLMERIAETVKNNIIEGISDLRDESDRNGVRIVIELKKDVDSNIILNQLYKNTLLQTTFNSNMLALNKGKPEQMNLKDMLTAFIEFREEVITKRTIFDLNKARDKAHILLGLVVANANIDEIINLIKSSKDSKEARQKLINKKWKLSEQNVNFIKLVDEEITQLDKNIFILTDSQARAILELRLHRLTSLERDDIQKDLEELILEIKGHLEILQSRLMLLDEIKKELKEIKKEFASPRKSEIIDREYEEVNDLRYIQKEDIVITISNNGYIKRSLLENYRAQNRGGKGKTGMSTREEDFVKEIHLADTHTKLLVFSSLGKVYALKSHDIPEASLKARGKPIVNLLPFSKDEKIASFLPLPIDEDSWSERLIIFATKKGMIRKNKLIDVAKSGKRELRESGKLAIKLDSEDQLIGIKLANYEDDVLLSTKNGKCLRFPLEKLRLFTGLNSSGVRGIKLEKNNHVISQAILKHSKIDINVRKDYLRAASENRKNTSSLKSEFAELNVNEEFLLALTTNGYGKRSSAYEYRISNRGGKGITGILTSEKNGEVIDCFVVNDNDQIILVTDKGQIIRVNINQIRIAGRSTRGVNVFKIPDSDSIVSISRIQELDT
ncbi:MAG: DNA gyrase subunit A [Pelagibacteraceae bacterium]|nr:DNA gyrase subunit A [Pelagibacteraceae bacterium]